uniref:Uncharacterized protein n=1 Tax=Plectus sambesii TaxID=2011161 RepID=A0A914X3K7_9BILA
MDEIEEGFAGKVGNLTSWPADRWMLRAPSDPFIAAGHCPPSAINDALTTKPTYSHTGPPIGQLLSPIFAAKSGIRWLIDLPGACSANQRRRWIAGSTGDRLRRETDRLTSFFK